MTVNEAASFIGVSGAYIRMMIKEGRIKASRIGPMWNVSNSSVMAFKRKREAAA